MMTTTLALLGIPLGLLFMFYGARWLVDGAKKAAVMIGVSPFLIGLTIVSFGDSAPHAVMALMSARSSDIVLGTVVGSNLASIGLIIGLSALIYPLCTRYETIRQDMYALLLTTFALPVLGLMGAIGLWEGCILMALMFVFILVVYKGAHEEHPHRHFRYTDAIEDLQRRRLLVQLGIFMGGLIVLGIGAEIFVEGALELSSIMNVPELVIGLVVVALGASTPALFVSATAAYRGEVEIAVSNVVGSNIFHALFVLGLGAAISPISIPASMFMVDLPALLILTTLLFLVIRFRCGVDKRWGAVFLSLYVLYLILTVAYQVL